MSELLPPRTPGASLRAAREKRGLSIADIVESTRIKSHIITALEHDDYSVIAAPLYGKGFIKLYAEHVGLDPAPLVQYYLNYYARTVRPTLKTETPPPAVVNDGIPQPSPLARFRESGGSALTNIANSITTGTRDALTSLAKSWTRLQDAGRSLSEGRPGFPWQRAQSESEPIPVGRLAAIGFAVLVVVILVGSAVYLVSGGKEPSAVPVSVTQKTPFSHALRLALPPPAPYIKLK